MRGLLVDNDMAVASWTHQKFNIHPMPVNKAIGIVSEKGEMIGGILFQNYNGCNLELSYYGPMTLSPGIVRVIARTALGAFNVSRLSVITSRKNRRLIRGLLKFEFKIEGAQRCFYGHEDNRKNTGIRLVAFRDALAKVAYRIKPEKKHAL